MDEKFQISAVLDLLSIPKADDLAKWSYLLTVGSISFTLGYFSIFDTGFIFTISVHELIIVFGLSSFTILVTGAILVAFLQFYAQLFKIQQSLFLQRIRYTAWPLILILVTLCALLFFRFVTWDQDDHAGMLLFNSCFNLTGMALMLIIICWTLFIKNGDRDLMNPGDTNKEEAEFNRTFVTWLYPWRFLFLGVLGFGIMFEFGRIGAAVNLLSNNAAVEVKFSDGNLLRGTVFYYSDRGILLVRGPGSIVFAPFDSIVTIGKTKRSVGKGT